MIAHKRALWRAGYFAGQASKFDDEVNAKLAAAIRHFQGEHGIPQTGALGLATYTALRATPPKDPSSTGKSAYDATAEKILRAALAAHAETPEQKARRLGVDAAYYWIVHRSGIAYAQVRPMRLVKPPTVPPVMDCSWYATDVYYAANAPDPNDRGYDGQGYTGTLVDNGERISLQEARPLDLIFYGFTTNPTPAFPYGSPTHVAVYLGGGYAGSHGGQSGPVKVRANYRPIHSVRRYPLVR